MVLSKNSYDRHILRLLKQQETGRIITMSTQSPLPQNDPMLIAFQKLKKKTPEYKNAVNWAIKAESESQADGELWFAFAAGYDTAVRATKQIAGLEPPKGEPMTKHPDALAGNAEIELLPCPFCGESNAELLKNYVGGTFTQSVQCKTDGCHIETMNYGLGKNAVSRWNTRTAARPQDDGERERDK